MSAVAAPADRRFRRTHVRPSRTRRRWAGRITPLFRYAVAAVALSYGVYRGSSSVVNSTKAALDVGSQRLISEASGNPTHGITIDQPSTQRCR